MRLRMFFCAAALACAACTHTSERSVAVARVDGAQHVVVRAEAGRVWWSHRDWTEPHELWQLPGGGAVQNLAVARDGDGFVVTFEQGGETWQGRFGESTPTRVRLARGH
jgi:hypothetical protein